MFKIAAFLLVLIAAFEQASRPRAGVMVTTAGRGVLAIEGPILARDSIITLVTIDNPQKVSWVAVADQLTNSEVMERHVVPGPYYTVTATPASNPLPSLEWRLSAGLKPKSKDLQLSFELARL
jgi:hypothetical protein